MIRLLEANYVDIEQPDEFRRPKRGHAHGAGGRAATEPAEFGETQQKNAPQRARQMVTAFGPIKTPARESGLSRFKCVNVDRDRFQPMFAGGRDGIPFRDPMTCCGWRLIRIKVRIATFHFGADHERRR